MKNKIQIREICDVDNKMKFTERDNWIIITWLSCWSLFLAGELNSFLSARYCGEKE